MNDMNKLVGLSKPTGNHISLYVDPEIYRLEQQRIFQSTWVYVGHESEVPAVGDYKTSFIGDIPVIVTRSEDGKVNVMGNRCTHRGATVCSKEFGNTDKFVCPYHAWAFRLDGSLDGVGLPRGYNEGEIDWQGQGLPGAAKVGSYRGLIFASLNPDVHSLDDHLGNCKKYIDLYCDLSPAGEIVVGKSGIFKQVYEGNWKIQLEGSVEGYHVWHTHKTAVEQMGKWVPTMLEYHNLEMNAYDLGYGHNVIENYQLGEEAVKQRWSAEFIDQLIAAHGEKRTMAALSNRFNLVVFPNMAILEYQIRVIRPLAPDRTEVRTYHTAMKDVPKEIALRRVREHEFFYGPMGWGGPDDNIIFERIQAGYKVPNFEWVMFNRGLTTEQVDALGRRYCGHTQETQQRAPYYEYRRLMGISPE